MCGRFTLKVDPNTIYEALELGEMPQDLEPRYNIAPSQPVAVVTDPATRQVEMFRWGLIPFWAKDPKVGYSTINARAETVATKPAFREAFKKRRCSSWRTARWWRCRTGRSATPTARRSGPRRFISC